MTSLSRNYFPQLFTAIKVLTSIAKQNSVCHKKQKVVIFKLKKKEKIDKVVLISEDAGEKVRSCAVHARAFSIVVREM